MKRFENLIALMAKNLLDTDLANSVRNQPADFRFRRYLDAAIVERIREMVHDRREYTGDECHFQRQHYCAHSDVEFLDMVGRKGSTLAKEELKLFLSLPAHRQGPVFSAACEQYAEKKSKAKSEVVA